MNCYLCDKEIDTNNSADYEIIKGIPLHKACQEDAEAEARLE